MSSQQLQTLIQDSQELRLYAEKLMKKGKQDIALKILKKQRFLDEYIEQAKNAA